MMSVGKRIALGVLGVLLVLVFFGWLLVRQQEHLGMDSLLGWGAWALAWVCLLGGASLLARSAFRRGSKHQDSTSRED